MLTPKKISTRASKEVVWLSTNQKIKARLKCGINMSSPHFTPTETKII